MDASNNCTLIGSTANDTTLWASPSTSYTRALSETVAITQGSRYAIGILVVTAATMPFFYGNPAVVISEALVAPFMAAQVGSQTDLPTPSISAGSLAASTSMIYTRLKT